MLEPPALGRLTPELLARRMLASSVLRNEAPSAREVARPRLPRRGRKIGRSSASFTRNSRFLARFQAVGGPVTLDPLRVTRDFSSLFHWIENP